MLRARSTELRPKDSSLTKPPEDDYVALYTGGSPPAVEQTRHPPRAKSEESARYAGGIRFDEMEKLTENQAT
jgi:hypothetical protein